MIRQEQIQEFDTFVVKAKDIMKRKGEDYANEDVLSNFKLAGSIVGLSPEMNCLSLIAVKVARLGVLLNSGKQPNNESIIDSVDDLQIYSFLLRCILREKQADKCFDIVDQIKEDIKLKDISYAS